jgi:hypothetical protein
MKIRALALHLGEIGGKPVRLGGGQCDRKALGEVLHFRPFARGPQRHHYVQPLAAGQHRKCLQTHVGQEAPQVPRRLPHLIEAEPLVGIEVEDQPVRLSTSAVVEPQPWNSIVPI